MRHSSKFMHKKAVEQSIHRYYILSLVEHHYQDMQYKLLIAAGLCICFSWNAKAQTPTPPVDKNIAVFSILKQGKAIEVPANKALILLKPEVQLGEDVLSCDSAYFTLGKKFEAFGHVKIKQADNKKVISKNYLSITVIENSAYFKNSMVTR